MFFLVFVFKTLTFRRMFLILIGPFLFLDDVMDNFLSICFPVLIDFVFLNEFFVVWIPMIRMKKV